MDDLHQQNCYNNSIEEVRVQDFGKRLQQEKQGR